MIAQKIAQLFATIEEVWDAVPGYFKVFIYSTVSSVAGLYFTEALSVEAVVAILLANLGLYSIPKGANTMSKKLG